MKYSNETQSDSQFLIALIVPGLPKVVWFYIFLTATSFYNQNRNIHAKTFILMGLKGVNCIKRSVEKSNNE